VNSTASNIREDKHFPGEDICKIGLEAKVSLKNERGREGGKNGQTGRQ